MKITKLTSLAFALCLTLFACDKAENKNAKDEGRSAAAELATAKPTEKAPSKVAAVKQLSDLTPEQKILNDAGDKFIKTPTALPENFVEILELYRQADPGKSELLVSKLLEYRQKKGPKELDEYEDSILLQCLRKGYIRYDMLWK